MRSGRAAKSWERPRSGSKGRHSPTDRRSDSTWRAPRLLFGGECWHFSALRKGGPCDERPGIARGGPSCHRDKAKGGGKRRHQHRPHALQRAIKNGGVTVSPIAGLLLMDDIRTSSPLARGK